MIKNEEYDIVGYVMKTCICDRCMCEMKSIDVSYTTDPIKRIMKCPKCGKEEAIDADALSPQFKLVKKKENEDGN